MLCRLHTIAANATPQATLSPQCENCTPGFTAFCTLLPHVWTTTVSSQVGWMRRKYIPAYVECLQQNKMGGDEETRKMDESLSEPTILLFRRLAHTQARCAHRMSPAAPALVVAGSFTPSRHARSASLLPLATHVTIFWGGIATRRRSVPHDRVIAKFCPHGTVYRPLSCCVSQVEREKRKAALTAEAQKRATVGGGWFGGWFGGAGGGAADREKEGDQRATEGELSEEEVAHLRQLVTEQEDALDVGVPCAQLEPHCVVINQCHGVCIRDSFQAQTLSGSDLRGTPEVY